MAVEDDPNYPRWRAALERLMAAKKALREAAASGRPIDRAELELARARAAYHQIADEV